MAPETRPDVAGGLLVAKAKKKVAKRKPRAKALPGEGVATEPLGFAPNLNLVSVYSERELEAKATPTKKLIKIPKKYRALFKMLKQLGFEPSWVIDEGYGDRTDFAHWRKAQDAANRDSSPSQPEIHISIKEEANGPS